MQALLDELAPSGTLRAAINMSNFLLVTGESTDGQPEGVSPDLARAIAEELGVGLSLIPFKGPGELADAVSQDIWDIGNIAEEPERARTIRFSPAYCEIQATYLLPPDSEITDIQDVDKPGIRIAVKERSAYDLWLTDNIESASLVKAATIDESFEVFKQKKLDVLAGLRPKLVEQAELLPGARVLQERFTAIRQCVGCRPDRPLAADFLDNFIKSSVADGLIESLIQRHGVSNKLSVASAIV